MRKAYVVAVICAALSASASGVGAQQVKAREKAMAAGTSPSATAAVKGAPGTHGRMLQLQAGAVAAAEQVERLAHASRLDRSALGEQALKAQGDLQAVEHQLMSAEQHATGAEKQHLAAVRGHEDEALRHAQAMCDGASKDPAMVIAMHAQAVVEHARAAEKAMGAGTATDSWMSTDVRTGKHQ